MATTETGRNEGEAVELPNTRANEILAVALFAVGALVLLCLVSYNPNDPSWNSFGGRETRNFIGVVGANLSALLYQALGLAAPLVPVLLFIVAWRRFRVRTLRAPLLRVVGLTLLVLTIAALLALFSFRPVFDASVEPGGLLGAAIARMLMSGVSRVGSAVLLFAIAAVGVLLATDFSFVNFYEQTIAPRLSFFHALPERFRLWRERRRQIAAERAEVRRARREEILREQESDEAFEIASDEEIHPASPLGLNRPTVRPSETNKRSARTTAREETFAENSSDEEAFDEVSLPVNGKSAPKVEASRKAGAANGASANSNQTSSASRADSPRERTRLEINFEEASSRTPTQADGLYAMLDAAEVVRTEEADDETIAPFNESAINESATPARAKRKEVEKQADDFKIPPLDFLNAPPPRIQQQDDELLAIAARVAEKCREFNVTGKIEHICPGPVVTTYEFKPDPGVKYSRVTGLVDDLCLALKAESIRIDRVPGKAHVGIEVPNPERETIFLREVLESRQFAESQSKLTLALGKTIDGIKYVADLARMPHLLIAGATGTGKSVCLNALVVSILYKARPDEVKFIMIDPKRLELGLYADIPHLATPIITDPKRASLALKWAVREMENRYKELAKWSVRNIDGFNTEVARRNKVKDFDENGEPHKTLPFIVIIIDELADLMMVAGNDVEESITRLAQMARAVGIHLVLATQRPSVDVITGLIKANFPSRIAFRVSSKVDSRTILDCNGAEQLLGRGDMLFLPPGTSRLVRVHGAYLDETEVSKIVAHIKAQSRPEYNTTITQSEEEAAGGAEGAGGERDELFDQALRICVEMKRASTSVLQRRLRIGYGRAAKILDAMEREGFIAPSDGSSRPRPVLPRAFETVSHWDEIDDGVNN